MALSAEKIANDYIFREVARQPVAPLGNAKILEVRMSTRSAIVHFKKTISDADQTLDSFFNSTGWYESNNPSKIFSSLNNICTHYCGTRGGVNVWVKCKGVGFNIPGGKDDAERNKRVGDFVIVRNDGDASKRRREEGGEQAAARQMEAAQQMAAERSVSREEVARRRQADEAMKKAKNKEKKKKREYALKVRTETYIAIKKKELGNVPKLPKAIKHFLKQRLQIEHKQELACMGYLNNEVVCNQVRLYAPPGGTVNPANPRYVITDVLQPLSGPEEAELQLKDDKEVKGLPWEVKDCDGMNPVEHSHGQSDYQRIFANCKKGSLWLFTEDLLSSKGRQNFEVLCNAILPYNKDRYDKVILSQRLQPYDCEEVSMQDAEAAVIAVWNSSDGTIHWKKSEPIPDRSPEMNVNATTTPGNAAAAAPMEEDVLGDLGLPPLGPQSQ